MDFALSIDKNQVDGMGSWTESVSFLILQIYNFKNNFFIAALASII